MTRKTISIISYITILGWAIAFVVYHNGGRSSLAQYHLKQSFGLGVLGAFLSVLFMVSTPIIPAISMLFMILSIVMFIILISGIINSANQKERPTLLIGSMFEDKFNFIKY